MPIINTLVERYSPPNSATFKCFFLSMDALTPILFAIKWSTMLGHLEYSTGTLVWLPTIDRKDWFILKKCVWCSSKKLIFFRRFIYDLGIVGEIDDRRKPLTFSVFPPQNVGSIWTGKSLEHLLLAGCTEMSIGSNGTRSVFLLVRNRTFTFAFFTNMKAFCCRIY